MHHTPVAALAALNRTRMPPADAVGGARPAFLREKQQFLRAGVDERGRELYAVWMKADGIILTRLIESFCELYRIPRDQYVVQQITGPLGFRLQLVILTYQCGLYGLGGRLLAWLGYTPQVLVVGRTGVDGTGELVDNAE